MLKQTGLRLFLVGALTGSIVGCATNENDVDDDTSADSPVRKTNRGSKSTCFEKKKTKTEKGKNSRRSHDKRRSGGRTGKGGRNGKGGCKRP